MWLCQCKANKLSPRLQNSSHLKNSNTIPLNKQFPHSITTETYLFTTCFLKQKRKNNNKDTSDKYWVPSLGPSSGSIKASNPPLSTTTSNASSSNCKFRKHKTKFLFIKTFYDFSVKELKLWEVYLHGGHVHDAPAHIGPMANIAAEAVGNGDLGEVNVGDGIETGVV